MVVGHIDDVSVTNVQMEGVQGMVKQVPVGPAQGWEGYVMRVFTLEAGGHSPRHRHPWPHINWVVSGRGIVHVDGKDINLREGSFAYLPAGALHQFTNPGSEPFKFICIVPEEGDK